MLKKMKKVEEFLKKVIKFISDIPHDKLLHLFATYVIVNVINAIWSAIFHPSYGGIIVSLIITFIIIMGKEIYDYYHRDKETPEVMDIVYGLIGSFISSIISLLYLL